MVLQRISVFVSECLSLKSTKSFHFFLLTFVVAYVLWKLLKTKKPKMPQMSWEEEEEMLRKFDPEPLVPETKSLPKLKIVQSRAGKRVVVDGKTCLNLATFNYLGFVEDEEITKEASECINKYGVGSCGPRGFYGTADVHLELEERLAEFFNVEEACVYSYGFCTAASAIPSYCKRSDIIFVDESVNFSIQKGLDASRSQIVYFKHNDTADLERLLIQHPAGEKQRRFLVAEGLYLSTGDLCPLPELVRLRAKYKLRMFLDESVSFATIGATGRGVMEHFNVPLQEVDLRFGSLEGALASIGGFCCGTSFIVEHQRLSGLGYCFSASVPPLLAVAAIKALAKLNADPHLAKKLQEVSKSLHTALADLPGLTLSGDPLSPVKHLRISKTEGYEDDRQRLLAVTEACFDRGLAIVTPSHLPHVEKFEVSASIRLVANVMLSGEDIAYVRETLREACSNTLF